MESGSGRRIQTATYHQQPKSKKKNIYGDGLVLEEGEEGIDPIKRPGLLKNMSNPMVAREGEEKKDGADIGRNGPILVDKPSHSCATGDFFFSCKLCVALSLEFNQQISNFYLKTA